MVDIPTHDEIKGMVSACKLKIPDGFIGGKIRYRDTDFWIHFDGNKHPTRVEIINERQAIFLKIPDQTGS